MNYNNFIDQKDLCGEELRNKIKQKIFPVGEGKIYLANKDK